MTFAESLYNPEQYRKIHFIGTEEPSVFQKMFPALQNSYSRISEDQKALYHSLCVLSGNGTTLLWDLIEQEFAKMGLPHQAIEPYFQQVVENIEKDLAGRWTGPWYRNDKATIAKNHKALQGRPLQKLYDELTELSQLAGIHNEKHSRI